MPVVLTGPVRTTGYVVVFASAAAPVTLPVIVSVPDACVTDTFAACFAGLPPDDEQPAIRATAATVPAAAAKLGFI
jgi:hypothetical protein